MKKIFGLILFLVMVTAVSADTRFSSPLSVEIKMTKAEFALYEPVDGQIVITNKSTTTFPATFDITLYHDGAIAQELSTQISSFLPGDNKYNLKELGIPDINDNSGAEGHWYLVITQKDLDESYSAKADFIIQNESIQEKK